MLISYVKKLGGRYRDINIAITNEEKKGMHKFSRAVDKLSKYETGDGDGLYIVKLSPQGRLMEIAKSSRLLGPEQTTE